MAEQMPMVKNCPRCGSDEISHGYSIPPVQGIVSCHSDGCEITTVAESERQAIQRWNAGKWDFRVVERDDNGNPIWVHDGPGTATPSADGKEG